MSGKSTTTEQIRDFTQGKIFNQLIALAMPLMAVSFIQMTYNLVDIAIVYDAGIDYARDVQRDRKDNHTGSYQHRI